MNEDAYLEMAYEDRYEIHDDPYDYEDDLLYEPLDWEEM